MPGIFGTQSDSMLDDRRLSRICQVRLSRCYVVMENALGWLFSQAAGGSPVRPSRWNALRGGSRFSDFPFLKSPSGAPAGRGSTAPREDADARRERLALRRAFRGDHLEHRHLQLA